MMYHYVVYETVVNENGEDHYPTGQFDESDQAIEFSIEERDRISKDYSGSNHSIHIRYEQDYSR